VVGPVKGRIVVTSQETPQAVVQVTPDLDFDGGGVYNPSFDVTPAELISAIVTEKGVATNNGPGGTLIKVEEVV
jgi:methylthioribose-1-phosphate isomerase